MTPAFCPRKLATNGAFVFCTLPPGHVGACSFHVSGERADAAIATLQAENLRLKLLVAAFTAVDNLDADPLVRVIEAAHKHGRKLEREEIAALFFRLAEPGDTSIDDIAAAIRRGDR